MLENDDALPADERGIRLVAEPHQLLLTHAERAMLHRVQADEAIAADGERVMRRAQLRLIGDRARIVMRVVIADQRVKRHLSFPHTSLKRANSPSRACCTLSPANCTKSGRISSLTSSATHSAVL